MIVHRNGVVPMVAYKEVYGILEANGALKTCADMLAWLRVACTARRGTGELAALSAVAQRFPQLL